MKLTLRLLNFDFFLLRNIKELTIDRLHSFKVFFDHWRNFGFGYSDTKNIKPRYLLREIFLQGRNEFFVQTFKFININLLKSVFSAKLVDFVMNFVINPRSIVVRPIKL